MELNSISSNWQGKRILITGHTGFKGVWLSNLLSMLGADLYGLSLPISDNNVFYKNSETSDLYKYERFFDIRDAELVNSYIEEIDPHFIFHMAAQAIVSVGFEMPFETFDVNVNGTANVLNAIIATRRSIEGICVITSDKVYVEPSSTLGSHVETDPLGGDDPYSISKAATELIVKCMYGRFSEMKVPVLTVRAGNVIGGGDQGKNRLVPDIITAIQNKSLLLVRNMESTRPFQYVLDCLWGYIIASTYSIVNQSKELVSFNFGPIDSLSVGEVINEFKNNFEFEYQEHQNSQFHERGRLSIDSSKAKTLLGWKPTYTSELALRETIYFYNFINSNHTYREAIQESILRWQISSRNN